jgi:hypothetical protein
MPRRCTVCAHQARAMIDAALISGAPLRDIAGRHGVSKSSLERHKADHLPTHLAKAKDAGEVARAEDLLSQLCHLQGRTLKILESAEATGELRVALGAIGQARGNLELLAKLLGKLSDQPYVNVLVSAEWVQVRTAVVRALEPFPEARTAVAERLKELEAG